MHYVSLYQIIRKPKSLKNSIGGPVMIFSAGRDYIKEGAAKGLQFVAFLNIVLMVMNLLPIPVLDGGHIMFSFIEGIRGKKLSLKTQLVLQQLGIFFLLSLMIYAFYSDFSGLFSRYYKN
jgi:regulator of sigma E protease